MDPTERDRSKTKSSTGRQYGPSLQWYQGGPLSRVCANKAITLQSVSLSDVSVLDAATLVWTKGAGGGQEMS